VKHSSDDSLLKATVNEPNGIAIDKTDNIYFTEWDCVRVIPHGSGKVHTMAGHSGKSGEEDGPGSKAHFSGLRGIAIHPNQHTLYVVDGNKNRIRTIELTSAHPEPKHEEKRH